MPTPPVRYRIVSVDDHLIEPPDLFEGPDAGRPGRPGAADRHRRRRSPGVDLRGEHLPEHRAQRGRRAAQDEWSMEPADFDEMRRGCWDIHARIADMDLAGIGASVCFPSLIAGFCGSVFSQSTDPELGLACVKAWNDWHHEVWAGTYPGRIIPTQITWLLDPQVAADIVRANAERGFRALSFAGDAGQARAAVAAHRPLGSRCSPRARRPTRWCASTPARRRGCRCPATTRRSRCCPPCSRSTPTSPPPTGSGRACAPASRTCASPCPRVASAG